MNGAEDQDTQWQQVWTAVHQALRQWRQQHPTATFNELEDAVDQQVQAVRTRLLEDLTLASRAADLQAKHAGAPPRCPRCGERLVSQGKRPRQVQVHGNQTVSLHRDYAVCPACGGGLFPPG
jgi:hypothetical protein